MYYSAPSSHHVNRETLVFPYAQSKLSFPQFIPLNRQVPAFPRCLSTHIEAQLKLNKEEDKKLGGLYISQLCTPQATVTPGRQSRTWHILSTV